MGMYHHALMFFGVYVYEVNLDKLLEMPELAGKTRKDIDAAVRDGTPLLPGIYITCLNANGAGWAVSADIPYEVQCIEKPLDAFAGDRTLLLRVAKLLDAYPYEPTYVGWQVRLGFY